MTTEDTIALAAEMDAALIDAHRMGLELGLRVGLMSAAAAVLAHEKKCSAEAAAAVETAIRDAIDDGAIGWTEECAAEDANRDWGSISDTLKSTDVFDEDAFFERVETLAKSRGFRRLSARRIIRGNDREICYEVDGDVNLSPRTE